MEDAAFPIDPTDLPEELWPHSPREALLMIAAFAGEHYWPERLGEKEAATILEVIRLALRSREDIRMTDRLGDQLAKALNLLGVLRDGGADVATLAGEIDEVLAMAPDMEAMLELRGMKHRPS